MNDNVRAAAVAAFRDENDRWPSSAAVNGPEQTLGIWLDRQRVSAVRGTMSLSTARLMDAILPGWMISPDERWMTKAREASDFVMNTGRLPRLPSERQGEGTLAAWLSIQVALAQSGLLRPDRAEWLVKHCPGWNLKAPEAAPARDLEGTAP